MVDALIEQFIRKMPKVELHVHAIFIARRSTDC